MKLHEFQRGWTGGMPETPCGAGSKIINTELQRAWIPQMVEKYEIQTIADIGAGDRNWISLINWPYRVVYEAFDLVPRDPMVQKFDLVNEIPPKRDLILCLWLLNHLPEENARKAVKNLFDSNSKYLMYTWWPDMPDFLDFGLKEYILLRTNYRGPKKIGYELRLIEC